MAQPCTLVLLGRLTSMGLIQCCQIFDIGKPETILLKAGFWPHGPDSDYSSCMHKATPTSVRKRETNVKTHAKRIMWMCRQTAFIYIRLCGVCLANRWIRRMLSVWSRYFKEKYIRNHTDVDIHSFRQPTNNQRNACSFACAANAEQATF